MPEIITESNSVKRFDSQRYNIMEFLFHPDSPAYLLTKSIYKERNVYANHALRVFKNFAINTLIDCYGTRHLLENCTHTDRTEDNVDSLQHEEVINGVTVANLYVDKSTSEVTYFVRKYAE